MVDLPALFSHEKDMAVVTVYELASIVGITDSSLMDLVDALGSYELHVRTTLRYLARSAGSGCRLHDMF